MTADVSRLFALAKGVLCSAWQIPDSWSGIRFTHLRHCQVVSEYQWKPFMSALFSSI